MNVFFFVAETLGFTSYAPPYLSGPSGKSLLLGANFASAGSGYDDKTAYLSVRNFNMFFITMTHCDNYK